MSSRIIPPRSLVGLAVASMGVLACRAEPPSDPTDTAPAGHSASEDGATTLADCFASHGLDGVCGPGELEWAAVGPHGCAAEQQIHNTGTAGLTLYYDVDGDITRIALGVEPSPIRIVLDSGARGLYPTYPWVGRAEAPIVPWREAFAEVHFELPKTLSLSEANGAQVPGRFWISGGEIDSGSGFAAAPDAIGEGCFDLLTNRAGDVR